MNDNTIKVTYVGISKNRVDIEYEVIGEWKKYFNGNKFFVEFNVDISDVPASVAVIPFMGDILPIAWYMDGTIEIEELDRDFYNCLPEVKAGYEKMYPNLEFKGKLIPDILVSNTELNNNCTAAFFSGGVDANYTLYSNIQDSPTLMTVWGADVTLGDNVGWDIVEKNSIRVAEENKLQYCRIKSNFREILNTLNLNTALNHPGWSWWHEFQHGIGLIALAAPFAYVMKIRKILIAASYTKETNDLTCASDPTIDNFVRFCGCSIFHDGYDMNRQDKVHFLVNYAKEYSRKIPLRVCWISEGGENCCVCEKCCRTMTALYLEDADPKKFGFTVANETDFRKIAVKVKVKVAYAAQRDWDILHNKFLEKYTLESCPQYWRWFYKGGTYAINHNFVFCVRKWGGFWRCKVKNLGKRLFGDM